MARLTANYQPVLRSLLQSHKWAAASGEAAALYIRLLLASDSHGRMYGDSELVFGSAAARLASRGLTASHVEGWLCELESLGLIQRYTADGDQLLQILGYFEPERKEKGRTKAESAFPDPPEPTQEPETRDLRPETRDLRPETRDLRPEAMGSQREPAGTHGDPLAPSPNGGVTKPGKAPTPTWQKVLDRPKYDALRADPAFGDAWASWIEWTRTPGSVAIYPRGPQAAALFNKALRGSGIFATAVEDAIAGNYQAPNPAWVKQSQAPKTPEAHMDKIKAQGERFMAGVRERRARGEKA